MLNDAAKGLEDADVQMPEFGNLGRDLAKEMKEETEEESNIYFNKRTCPCKCRESSKDFRSYKKQHGSF